MFGSLPNVKDAVFTYRTSNEFIFADYNDLIYEKARKERYPTGTCTPFSKEMYLTLEGKLLACESIDHRFELGHVTPEKVELVPEDIAKIYNVYYDELSSYCYNCYKADTCKGCIINMKISNKEKILCNAYMNRESHQQYLSSFLSYLEDNPFTFSDFIEGKVSPPVTRQSPAPSDIWFYLEPYVYVEIKKKTVFLYNSLTGQRLKYSFKSPRDKLIHRLLKRLMTPGNQRVLLLKAAKIEESPANNKKITDNSSIHFYYQGRR